MKSALYDLVIVKLKAVMRKNKTAIHKEYSSVQRTKVECCEKVSAHRTSNEREPSIWLCEVLIQMTMLFISDQVFYLYIKIRS